MSPSPTNTVMGGNATIHSKARHTGKLYLEVWLSGGITQNFKADTTQSWTTYRVTVTPSV